MKQIENITFIFISRERFDESFHYKQMEIKPLDFTQSLLFLQCIDDNRRMSGSEHPLKDLLMSRFGNEEKYISIIKSAQGNPLILELICVIFRYGGKELLARILIKPISEVEDEDNDSAASSYSGNQREVEESAPPKFTGQKKFTTMFFQDVGAGMSQSSRLGSTMRLTNSLQRKGTIRDTKELRKSRPGQRGGLFGEPKNKKMAATTQGPARRASMSLIADDTNKKAGETKKGLSSKLDLLAGGGRDGNEVKEVDAQQEESEDSALPVRADVDGDSEESIEMREDGGASGDSVSEESEDSESEASSHPSLLQEDPLSEDESEAESNPGTILNK